MNLTRRSFTKLAGSTALLSTLQLNVQSQEKEKPNVLLIITDDQGYGDLGVHGNEHINTPVMDSFAQESVHLKNFYVCPVCAPTRASLLTGRYNYRTGVMDTYLGRAMMFGDEVTLAESLGKAGYKTGIFGKWHLGDTYPMRPIDQGFQKAVVHTGGGIGQPSDPPGNTYFDPILQHNGEAKKYEGYCTDIYADETIKFLEENQDNPFFVYLPTNAPHTPLQIDDKYVQPYLDQGLDETTAKVYGMITNIDENMGRVLNKLDELNLADNTIVIFMTDNGAQQERYNAGLRGRKGTVYEGGIRVPFYIRWSKKWQAGRVIYTNTAHIDLYPTLLDICGAEHTSEHEIDGVSLKPLLNGTEDHLPNRNLFFQWHRGDVPEPFRASAVREDQYKLVNGTELFDINNDPGEERNIAEQNPDVVRKMREDYLAWFDEMQTTRGFAMPDIFVGTEHENPVILTRQDWRGPKAGWGQNDLGYWDINVQEGGNYDVRLQFQAVEQEGFAVLRFQGKTWAVSIQSGNREFLFQNIELSEGKGKLEPMIILGNDSVGVHYVDIQKR